LQKHNGIHIWEDDYLVEIINPETGELLQMGKKGNGLNNA